MNKKETTWAPLIPLIGGQMLGAEKAFGKPPVAIYSYDGFQTNDSHYVHYQQNILGRSEIPYLIKDGDVFPGLKGVDVISGTPPCAALSSLNTGKSDEVKGAGCAKNEWMYQVFEDAIDLFKAKVVVVENAPALFTSKGKGVADKLYEICKERGYSLTLYKTSTKFHGIPQARNRTFAIGWKSETAPIMNWYKRPRAHFHTYLKEIKENALHQDIVINPKVANEPYYHYIKERTKRDPRTLLIESDTKTAFKYVYQNGWLKDANEWFHTNNHELGIKYSDHALKKFEQGLGIWDGSVHVFNDVMNAVIGRNMNDTIHPEYDRSLTIREALYMMGFPEDFELLGGRKNSNMIAQNVPVPTSRDIHIEIQKFLNDELEFSDSDYLRQCNFKENIWPDEIGNVIQTDLSCFF